MTYKLFWLLEIYKLEFSFCIKIMWQIFEKTIQYVNGFRKAGIVSLNKDAYFEKDLLEEVIP
jgi:hypothetical protein